MKITIIVGSHRVESNSAKVGKIIEQVLGSEALEVKNKEKIEIETIDLGKNPIPLWNDKVWAGDPQWSEILEPYKTKLTEADAYVVISPEYNGMASPALKNFFLFWTGEVLAHKPALLVGVTSTESNGAYPIAELRASSYKNTRIVYIPDHLIVRSAGDLPSQISNFSEENQRLLSRIEYSVSTLIAYSHALQTMRENTDFDYKNFGNGM
jgi:NAD(P)H-dependent FMN reductase